MKLAAGTLFIVLLLVASLESLQFPLEAFIEETAPISKPDILIAVPLLDAVKEVPVIEDTFTISLPICKRSLTVILSAIETRKVVLTIENPA